VKPAATVLSLCSALAGVFGLMAAPRGDLRQFPWARMANCHTTPMRAGIVCRTSPTAGTPGQPTHPRRSDPHRCCPAKGDSTARIQKALDYVSNLAPDSNGLRGAVLLLRGRHEVNGGLLLNARASCCAVRA